LTRHTAHERLHRGEALNPPDFLMLGNIWVLTWERV